MFGPTRKATIRGRRPLRQRAAAWSAVLAFGLAQVLLSAHVHASTSPDESPEILCAACAFADDGQPATHSSTQAASLLRQRAAEPQVQGIVIERRAHSLQPRAPPSC